MDSKETLNKSEELNSLLLEMVKNQKRNNNNLVKIIIISYICFALIIISMVVGFFVYESQFEIMDKIVDDSYTYQNVDGENSEINNVEGNMYKDNAIHNEN